MNRYQFSDCRTILNVSEETAIYRVLCFKMLEIPHNTLVDAYMREKRPNVLKALKFVLGEYQDAK